jgi:hypothetical protein
MMKPFFRYYGSKHACAKRYGPPRYDHVIEVFAGSAAYSCYCEPPKVTLVEKDEVIVELWEYLKSVSPREIMRLPTNISHIDELPSWVPTPAKSLIGFGFNRNAVLQQPIAHLGQVIQTEWLSSGARLKKVALRARFFVSAIGK